MLYLILVLALVVSLSGNVGLGLLWRAAKPRIQDLVQNIRTLKEQIEEASEWKKRWADAEALVHIMKTNWEDRLSAEMNSFRAIETKKIREDAIKKSTAVQYGQSSEQLAPLLLKGFNPKEMHFLGQPIDYIVYEGLENLNSGISDEITGVTFLEIKTGKSDLTKQQRRIRDAIQEGRVAFTTVNLDTGEIK